MKTGIHFGLCFYLLFSLGCREDSAYEEVVSHGIPEGQLIIKTTNGKFQTGMNDILLEFRDPSGDLLPVENVDMSAVMSMPNMDPMINPVPVRPTKEKGQFAFTHTFAMSGEWKCELGYRLRGVEKQTTFEIDVESKKGEPLYTQ